MFLELFEENVLEKTEIVYMVSPKSYGATFVDLPCIVADEDRGAEVYQQ